MKTISPKIIEALKLHARTHCLDQRAENAVREWIKETKSEEDLPSGLNPEQIRAEFASRWLCFEPAFVSYAFIDTRYDLFIGKNKVGYYRMITTLDGKDDDDYFVLDDPSESS